MNCIYLYLDFSDIQRLLHEKTPVLICVSCGFRKVRIQITAIPRHSILLILLSNQVYFSCSLWLVYVVSEGLTELSILEE